MNVYKPAVYWGSFTERDPMPSSEPDGCLAYVLDDEPQVAALVCRVLATSGFAPRQFSTAAPFLEQLKVCPPVLVVLDLALGHSDAVEVIRHLKTFKYPGKVLLISGRDQATLDEVKQIGERHGLAMLPTLRKPFRARDLQSRLAAAPNLSASPPQTATTHRIEIDCAEALRNDWLELWYQPKFDLSSLSICGAEALLRLGHPKHGIVPPADFLPAPGDALYQPLTHFVIRQAMADWTRFADAGMPLKLSVNVPVSVLHEPDFITLVRQHVPANPSFPGLIVEVTEDEAIRDPQQVQEAATQLKLYDVLLSIDDFGAAYSSLSHLLALPCTELKLDRSFVSNCSSNKLKGAMCQTVIDLAHRFDIAVCGEGVESNEDLRALVAMGCDTAQGYLFARPMSADDLVQMLRSQQAQGTNAALIKLGMARARKSAG